MYCLDSIPISENHDLIGKNVNPENRDGIIWVHMPENRFCRTVLGLLVEVTSLFLQREYLFLGTTQKIHIWRFL